MLFKHTSSTCLFNIVIMTCLSSSKTVEHKTCLKKFKVKQPHSFLLNICPEPKSQHFFEYLILFTVLFFNKVTKHFSQSYYHRALIRLFSLKVSNQEIFCKKCVLKIPINSPENIITGVILQCGCWSENSAKFLSTPNLWNICEGLFLNFFRLNILLAPAN